MGHRGQKAAVSKLRELAGLVKQVYLHLPQECLILWRNGVGSVQVLGAISCRGCGNSAGVKW